MELPQTDSNTALLLIDEIAAEGSTLLAHDSQLESRKQSRGRLLNDIRRLLIQFQMKSQKGLSLLIEKATKENLYKVDEFSSFFQSCALVEKQLHNPQNAKNIIKQVIAGTTWKQILNLSHSLLSCFYDQSKEYFEEGNYEASEDAFSFLVWLENTQPDFWLGLGHSQYHKGHHEPALNSYAIASSLIPESPLPYLYACCCFEALDDNESASESLQEGLKIAQSGMHPESAFIQTIQNKMHNLQNVTQNLNS